MPKKSQDKSSRPSRPQKDAKTRPGRFSFKGRWMDMPEDRRIRLMKVTGLVVAVLAVFTFISVTSYLFTWQSDQSLLSEPQMLDSAVPAHNMGGKLGYKWGHFLPFLFFISCRAGCHIRRRTWR